jgi:hypothetical protein
MNKYLFYNDKIQNFVKADNLQQAESKIKEVYNDSFTITLFERSE